MFHSPETVLELDPPPRRRTRSTETFRTLNPTNRSEREIDVSEYVGEKAQNDLLAPFRSLLCLQLSYRTNEGPNDRPTATRRRNC